MSEREILKNHFKADAATFFKLLHLLFKNSIADCQIKILLAAVTTLTVLQCQERRRTKECGQMSSRMIPVESRAKKRRPLTRQPTNSRYCYC